ncbi:MAG: SusD/RagB family nutrient-binding outer membrane lipoprotein [Bacteroidales bacterium]|jgi:hypothetical protein|nr:SusD/RagB family nutrient-binding outer membrane lipoprotein [Bacteroidales bacterium]MCI2121864.1 SusD/RagB family nutrient-binding outer membrane lipoprotein [Bacteroidales bacterium]MCI2145718.1 SusD/RagB family nutrient-binding outer membrane lipoprotein [Bacteroidales bacterium]
MKQIKYIFLTVLAMGALASCTANFEEINENPNKTTVGSIQATGMFEPLLYWSANNWINDNIYYNNELIQVTAHTSGYTREEHRYKIEEQDWASEWNFYARYANNADHMHELAVNDENVALQAIALTMKVLFMSNMTDMFGDIPYSEAFSGRKVGGTFTPVFDSQEEVYEEMFTDLETANTLYATNPTFIKPEMDGMYGGDVKHWQKFNNSLYMRLLMRVSGRSSMNVGEKLTEMVDDPYTYPILTSNDDNATVNFSGIDPYISEYGTSTEASINARRLTRQWIKMNVLTDVSGEQYYEDPRLSIRCRKCTYTSTNPKDIWIGTIAGCTIAQQIECDPGTSWINYEILCQKDAPVTYMDYAEVELILSEAAERNLISGGESAAKAYYEAGVTASCERWSDLGNEFLSTPVTISSAQIKEYLKSDLGSWDRYDDKLQVIAEQKYLCLFEIGMEQWHEYRRTGFPELTIGDGAVYNDGVLPTRFAYPSVTMSTNSTNAKAALADMGDSEGENTMGTPVWWSKKAIESGD